LSLAGDDTFYWASAARNAASLPQQLQAFASGHEKSLGVHRMTTLMIGSPASAQTKNPDT
jgi:hypothetical protein